jgi:hypothetical protein
MDSSIRYRKAPQDVRKAADNDSIPWNTAAEVIVAKNQSVEEQVQLIGKETDTTIDLNAYASYARSLTIRTRNE